MPITKIGNQSKSLIFVAFAHNEDANTSVNIKNHADRSAIYYKNAMVALISAKKNNPDCDVAFVTNHPVPLQYQNLMRQNDIMHLDCQFTSFRFQDDYPWCLAYYKLCVMKRVLELKYGNYLMIDSDVFVQNNISMLWNWTRDYLVISDTNETTERWQNEMHRYLSNSTFIPHWGGEFIGASHAILERFVRECEKIFIGMNATDFVTIHGDEFIESLAIYLNDFKVKHAGMFVHRFWTRTNYRVKTVLPQGGISVLHVPAEKEYGMLKIYNYIIAKNRIPSQRKAQKMLHLHHPSFNVATKRFLMKFRYE